VLLGAAALLLSGCAPVVALDPAADATTTGCAEVSARLPDSLGDGTGAVIDRRETSAQATAAWGSPATVLLRCGVEPPAADPTCVEISGVAWIRDASDAPRYRFVTFGRTPATEVVVDGDRASGSTVLLDLVPALSALPASDERRCTDLADVPAP
jgi:hypothetical protein